jgi:hypothetical protein
MNEPNAYHSQVNRLQIQFDMGMLSREDLLSRVEKLQSEQDFSFPEPQSPQVICSWHPLYNDGATLILKDGDPAKRSDGCCEDCLQIQLDEIRQMRAQQSA